MCGLNYASSNAGRPVAGTVLGFNAFNFMTDGVTVLLMLIKLCYGLRYLKIVSCPPKKAYEYLEEFGDLKWHTRRVKAMRLLFKDYFIASTTAYLFIFLQTVVLISVFSSH
jgi:hypothetical protein